MGNITNDQNIKAWTEATEYVINKFTDEGDFYRKHVINPALFSLLGDISSKKILDAGCGEGYLCRMMAKMGAIVTGLEPASGLINHATAREHKEKLGITYLCDDLSKWHEKQHFFDIVVANMVLMDIPDYKLAIKNCVAALKKGGLFIFSISHPCFDVEEGWKEEESYVQVKNYFDEYKIQNYIGYSFHHTLSTYVNILSDFGCCINKMLEPRLPLEVANQNKKFERDKHVPNFLIIKCIK